MIITNTSTKINFTDEHDVFIGFDACQQCCEQFDWFITEDTQATNTNDAGTELTDYSGYFFDTSFFAEEYFEDDGANVVIFKLRKTDSPDLYLHFCNSHNGYYSHGFHANIKGVPWTSGSI